MSLKLRVLGMLGFWDFPSIFGEKYLEQQPYASALYEQASVPMIRTFFQYH